MTVRAALAQLPAAQRELLRLAYFEQLTQPEIAEQLGIPVGTVKSRTFQAMAKLRAVLHEPSEPEAEEKRAPRPRHDCRRLQGRRSGARRSSRIGRPPGGRSGCPGRRGLVPRQATLDPFPPASGRRVTVT
jgi:hypothetical protein